MKVLITGASGFAGSHLVEHLAHHYQHELFGTAYSDPGFIKDFISEDNIVRIDLTDREAVFSMIEKIKPDWIFHLAAFAAVGSSFEKAMQTMQNNTVLQFNLLEAVRAHSPSSRILVIGSAEEYGLSNAGELPINEHHPLRPVNPYAVSKVTQDLLAYSYAVSQGLNIIRVRPFNHIGERQTPDFAIPAFAKQIVAIERGEQQELRVGNLDAIRDFSDVKDIVRAYVLLMEKGTPGEVYNIGSGVGRKMLDMLQMLVSHAKIPVNVIHDEGRVRAFDVPEMVADATKIQELGWTPEHEIEETMSRVLEWWREQE